MISEKHFNGLIQRTLLSGVFLSFFLILAGFAFTAGGRGAGLEILRAGLLVLILTPAARVGMLIYGYWRCGEPYFAILSLVVLALLVGSLFL